ncbi:LysR family transcriptional regulator [Ureibacillus massiliensis 4400831 = CIP 108448 = CCUG 49529]|uniref:LysR family transcriptional regulator n=1 Tax=Ureibacillus massiliensis 4400831 = CIP 108448 = CCUG 49529 TaxID=1211035 RepID=A0A0A3IZQ4_9BACL|nr:LysR family transcriptional regulator [Ureibacillus massiliensis]KGR90196.1 LysR family transcriptional regulator [Ureibacillus massiliensis 4400831 = CIP 108448 = CCUG 49529]
MNFEQLEYLKEVIETKSMSIAAKNLHVTQSAISQSISLLEKEFGVQLFKRSRNGTIPTEEGKNIITKALEILIKTDELKEEIQSLKSSYIGELKIATVPSIFMTYLPKALSKFKKDFPQIKVTIMEMENKEVIEEVNENRVDLGLIAVLNSVKHKFPEHFSFHAFHSQGTFNVIVPKDSILAINKELQLMDIREYPFVIYGKNFYNNLIEDFEKEYGPINIIFKSTNSEVIKKSVSEGIGISLFSSMMLIDDPYLESGRIISIPLKGYPLNFNLLFGGIYSKNRSQSRLIKKFLEYFEE